MILYFADRYANVIGLASTDLPDGYVLYDDKKTEDLDSGVASFECDIAFSPSTHEELRGLAKVGNYIFRSNGKEKDLFIIIQTEDDSSGKINIYAEDAGLDLLNETVPAYTADAAHPIAWYIEKYTYDTGFELGYNAIPDLTRTLSWDSEETNAARLRSVATQFDAEISYSFDIDQFRTVHKYVNIWKTRGQDTDMDLRLHREVSSITVKQSIANLATALNPTGGTPEGSDTAITLSGYSYDDGDIYVDGTMLKCRSALQIWSRHLIEDGEDVGHIVQTYSYDTTSQAELCSHAVTKLRQLSQPETEYDIEFAYLPEELRIGDRVRIIDGSGGLRITARITKLESSVSDKKATATLTI